VRGGTVSWMPARSRLPTVLVLAVLAVAGSPGPARAGEITQPCRTDPRAPADGELQRLAIWMSSVAYATPVGGGPTPPPRVGAFDAVRADLGEQAGSVGLDNARGTFYVRLGPGPLDAAAAHERFVRAVEQTVPAEHVAAILPRLRVVEQPYADRELEALRQTLAARIKAERPDVVVGMSVGCRESDDVRVEIDLYDPASEEAEAAVRRIAAEYEGRVVVTRRPYGPPTPGIGPAPSPAPRPAAPPVDPRTPLLAPMPPFAEAVAVRRRCGRRPSARIALAAAWRTRLRGFRVGTGPWRRNAVTVNLRRTVRVEVARRDGRRVVGRVARCPRR